MTRGEKVVSSICGAYLLAITLVTGCTGQRAALDECRAANVEASNGCLIASLKVQLETSVDVYSETLRAAGRAHSAGLLTDDQLERIRVAGRAAEKSLKAARAALAGAAEARESGTVLAAFADAQRALGELTALLGDSQ